MQQAHCILIRTFRPLRRNNPNTLFCRPRSSRGVQPLNHSLRMPKTSRRSGWLLALLLLLVIPSAAGAASISLAWDAVSGSPDGYCVYMRSSGQTYNYTNPAWQGSGTSCTLNQLQAATTYYFTARAYSGTTQSSNSNEVQYTTPAASTNQTPVANAGADKTVNPGAGITLDGSASRDPDGSIAAYKWTQISGRTCALSGANTARASFTAPSVTSSTALVFQLSVTDNKGLSATDTCQVTVVPAAPSDSDGDGLSDADETNIYHTNPNKADTDGDGISDGNEVQAGTDPLVSNNATASDKIWLEAEDGDINAPMQIAGDTKASEGSYISVPNGAGSGGDAVFTFTVGKAGTYMVWGRVIAPSGNDDSFFIAMDNGSSATWKTLRGSAWAWDKVRADGGSSPILYTLSAGQHTLTVQRREDGTRLDRILITSDTKYVPTGTGEQAAQGTAGGTPADVGTDPAAGDANIVLEAENGELSSPMQAQNDTTASSGKYIWVPQGTGNVSSPSPRAGSAAYTFDVDESGTYQIWGRVFSATYGDDSFFVSVDGQEYIRWNTQVDASWTWDMVQAHNSADPLMLELSAGTHTLSLVQREDGCKIDKLIITMDAGFTPES